MTLHIKGSIVSNDSKWFYEWLEYDAVCPRDVEKYLAENKNNSQIEVEINSGGGSVFAGSEIYTKLAMSGKEVVVNIVGLAGSSASVIAMAGKLVNIAPMGQIMIHNASMNSGGDKNDLAHAQKVLAGIDDSIANAYVLKTGLSKEQLLEMMNEESWIGAEKAIELGFADNIINTKDNTINKVNPNLLVASIENSINDEVIARLKEKLYNENTSTNLNEQKAKAQLELDLLTLKNKIIE